MIDMNQVHLAGRVVGDAELRYTKTGKPVLSFSMATNKKIGDEYRPSYHHIVCWNDAEDYGALMKGDYVFVDGELSTRSYEGKDGNKRYITEVIAFNIGVSAKANKSKSNFENYGSDEDVPF